MAKYKNIGFIKLIGGYKNKGIATFNYPFYKVASNTWIRIKLLIILAKMCLLMDPLCRI